MDLPISTRERGYQSVDSDRRVFMNDDDVGLTLTFENINFIRDSDPSGSAENIFDVEAEDGLKRDRHILHDVSGYARPAEILAVMGCSGSGKTTLVNLLSGRNTEGTMTGSVLLNGESYHDEGYTRSGLSCSFVDATEDSLYNTLTVREAMIFSARLRLPAILTDEDVKDRVSTLLEELDITKLGNVFIGSGVATAMGGGRANLSTGQRRLVSIATEVVAGKELLFLDEPTSGLDASNALSLVVALKKLVRTKRCTVVLVIHQPRNKIFYLLDRLLLLTPQGYCAYFGPVSGIEKYVNTEWDLSKPEEETMADYLLDMTAKLPPEQLIAIAERRKAVLAEETAHMRADVATAYQQYLSIQDETDCVNTDSTVLCGSGALLASQRVSGSNSNSSFAQKPKLWVQFKVCSERALKHRMRSRTLIIAIYSVAFISAFLYDCFYYDMDHTVEGFQNRCAVLTMMPFVTSLFMITLFESMQMERRVFELERHNGYYNPLAAQLAIMMVDFFTLQLVPPVLTGVLTFGPMNLESGAEEVMVFLIALILINSCTAGMCRVCGYVFRDVAIATTVAAGVILTNVLFSGFLVNPSTIPDFFSWIDELCWSYWGGEILLWNELGDTEYYYDLDLPNQEGETTLYFGGDTILEAFSIHSKRYTADFIALLLMTFAWNALAVTIALRFHRVQR